MNDVPVVPEESEGPQPHDEGIKVPSPSTATTAVLNASQALDSVF